MKTYDETGRVVEIIFSLQQLKTHPPKIQASRDDTALFEFLWEHPEYEQFFDIID